MRKIITGQVGPALMSADDCWLDIQAVATVEVTSEDPAFPIESVFTGHGGPGWRASQPGKQQIRIMLDNPVSLRLIRLRFEEHETARTQEFVLRWSAGPGEPMNEILRQQWTFSPAGSVIESEDYAVHLTHVSVLELMIDPNLGYSNGIASLAVLMLQSF